MFRSVKCIISIYYPCICMLSNSCDNMQNDYGQLLCIGNIFEKQMILNDNIINLYLHNKSNRFTTT